MSQGSVGAELHRSGAGVQDGVGKGTWGAGASHTRATSLPSSFFSGTFSGDLVTSSEAPARHQCVGEKRERMGYPGTVVPTPRTQGSLPTARLSSAGCKPAHRPLLPDALWRAPPWSTRTPPYRAQAPPPWPSKPGLQHTPGARLWPHTAFSPRPASLGAWALSAQRPCCVHLLPGSLP